MRGLVAIALIAFVAPLALAATVDISIDNFAFAPVTTTAAVGDTVRWTNDDGTAHTATSRAAPPRFDTGTILAGNQASLVFATKGSYPYWCDLHRAMLGYLQVGANTAPWVNVTLANGQVVSGIFAITGNVTDIEGPDTWVRITIDTTQITPQNTGLGVETSDIDRSYSVSWDTRLWPDGTHTVNVLGLDGSALTTLKTFSVTVDNPDAPDLSVSQPTGQGAVSKTLRTTVRNVGTVAAPASSVEFAYYDQDSIRHTIATASIPALAVGAATDATVTWDTTGKIGTWTIEAIADPANTIAEMLESNNVRTGPVTVVLAGTPFDVLNP